MSQLKLLQLFSLAIAIFFISAIPARSDAANVRKNISSQQVEKERLVLMPLRLGEDDQKFQGVIETALVEGLQKKYVVFSGEQVVESLY